MSNAENVESSRRYTSEDFKFGKEIGHGSFSTVMLAKDLRNGRQCAAKVVDKTFILRQKMRSTVMIEREALKLIKHPFFIDLICTFQDTDRLYFIMTYAEHGEILTHLNRLSCFDLSCTQFYSAEIIVALEYLHSSDINIVHRDLKPENILLAENMHIKICDFGSCLIINRGDLETPTFTGTPQFVSPEMLGFNKESEQSSQSNSDSTHSTAYLMDFWALGCIVYQLLSGRMPFHVSHSRHEYEIFQKIRKLDYQFPTAFDNAARDFVSKLLVINPLERLGNPSQKKHEALKTHPLFAGINFTDIGSRKPPLLSPNICPVVQDNWDEIPVGFEAAWRFNIKKEFQEYEKADKKKLLENQERQNPFHKFVKGRLILKQGILYKRRGLFSQKRMFLMTEGPHLFYVDPDAMILKKEVNLAQVLNVEIKSDKIFYIITKKRTYFLEDPSAKSEDWRQCIESTCQEHYPDTWRTSGSHPTSPGSKMALFQIASSSSES